MYKKLILSIIILFLCSCDTDIDNICWDNDPCEFLVISMEDFKDENGYYHVEYTGSTYHSVEYLTDPNGRVFWNSPDTFSVYWMYEEFQQPIISYSTYADDYGDGQQFFVTAPASIGDTLMIFGYVGQDVWDYLYFILEDNE
tara:strand:+ start:34 stop:459 length:426 start_codon:yes stop_codon:yes gene_type:complete